MKQAETLIKPFPDPKPEFYCHIHRLYYKYIQHFSQPVCYKLNRFSFSASLNKFIESNLVIHFHF